MIKCSLSILLAERNLKITKVSKETGISRTTLTALYYNTNQGIQFDTLNTLCKYLRITPSELILYNEYDVSLQNMNFYDGDERIISLEIKITDKNKNNIYHLAGTCDIDFLNEDDDVTTGVNVSLYVPIFEDDQLNTKNLKIKNYLQNLPRIFLTELEDDLHVYLLSELKKCGYKFLTDDSISFYWDEVLK